MPVYPLTESTEAISKLSQSKVMNLLNDAPISSPSPRAEMAMSWYVILMLRHHEKIHTCSFHREGAQWLNGRVLDSRPRAREFEPHQRHCAVSLSKTR